MLLTQHFRKCGLNIVTSALVLYQLLFGAGLFLKNISIMLSSYFFSALPLVRRISNIPTAAMKNVGFNNSPQAACIAKLRRLTRFVLWQDQVLELDVVFVARTVFVGASTKPSFNNGGQTMSILVEEDWFRRTFRMEAYFVITKANITFAKCGLD